MPNYNDYINIECNGFKEQVILNEEGYTPGPETEGVTFVLFSYGYYPGGHVDKEVAKRIFSDVFSHGSSNVMCHNSVMELCVKGDRQIFKLCMEKRIETLRARIMRVSNRDRWRRAYENNLRNFIRLYESIKYECSPASQEKLVTKSSKELMNMIVFLMLQAKNSNPSYRKYEPIDPEEFMEPFNDPNAPVITDKILKEYIANYSEAVPAEIQTFLGNKEVLDKHGLEVTLQILHTLQNEPTIRTLLVKHGHANLLNITPDPAGTIRGIVTTIMNIHTRTQKGLVEKLQRKAQEKAELRDDVKIERTKRRGSIQVDDLKADLAESQQATELLKAQLSKLKVSDTKVQEMKTEIVNLKRVFEETKVAIEQQRRELEDEKLRASTLTGSSLQRPSQVLQKQGSLDALIEQNRALEKKISYYSQVIEGKFQR